MHTVEEDFETELNKVPTPDLGLIKKQNRKTATFAFEFDETIDGSPIRILGAIKFKLNFNINFHFFF
jgi:hypothetical protein